MSCSSSSLGRRLGPRSNSRQPNGPRDLTVAEEGDNLTAQLAGQSAIPLLYLGNDTFGVGFDRALRFIFTMDGARAAKITLLQGGGRFEGPRK